MLVVKNITKFLSGKCILHNINFCLKKGEVVALVGPNGAGKTTLMRCIMGFYEPDEGEILQGKKSLSNDRVDVLKNIAYVPETGGIYPDMTVYEYIKFMFDIKKMSKTLFEQRFVNIVKKLDLESVINKKCDILSKGYKRRVAIAGAMISEPKVLILDEPTEGLDPNQKINLRDFLVEYAKKNIVLISTHIMEEVEAMANRILVINDGKLVCDTTPDDLKRITLKDRVEQSFYTIIGNSVGDKDG